MNRRFFKRCVLWLLPLLVMQSLVPVGFMLTAGDRGVELAFCPVQSAGIVQALGANHEHAGAHHAGHDAANPAHHEASRSGSCPFALASVAVTVHTTFVVATSFLQVDSLDTDVSTDALPAPLFASNRIRGPPQLS